MLNNIYNISCIELCEKMNSKNIKADLVYIDPPYNTHRDFGEFNDNYGTMVEYLEFILPILKEIHRVLKETGSFYLHVDPSVSHYLKVELDKIFGIKNFRNEIVWCYKSGGAGKTKFAEKHDTILFYTKTNNYTFNLPKEKSYIQPNGFKVEKFKDEGGWYTMVNCKDYWNIDMVGRTSSERIGYPTQKPEALLKRIILASSNPGDIVLDPMCGSGTTITVAKKTGRNWIGCDINKNAVDITNGRINSV